MTTVTAPADTPQDVLRRLRTEGRIYATTSEVGVILNYDRRTIIDGITAGEIPATRVMTSWRVPVSWILAQPASRMGVSATFQQPEKGDAPRAVTPRGASKRMASTAPTPSERSVTRWPDVTPGTPR